MRLAFFLLWSLESILAAFWWIARYTGHFVSLLETKFILDLTSTQFLWLMGSLTIAWLVAGANEDAQ